MKNLEMYPPKGKVPVFVHPSRVEQMKEQGWTDKPVKKTKIKPEVK